MAKPKTVLVVEDEPITREGLNAVLRRAGYEVVLAANGEEALSSIRRLPPDLILLDMLMPIMDGWRLLQLLKAEISTPIPIIVVTATILTREWANDHGCAGFLRKPIDPETTLEVIRGYLGESPP